MWQFLMMVCGLVILFFLYLVVVLFWLICYEVSVGLVWCGVGGHVGLFILWIVLVCVVVVFTFLYWCFLLCDCWLGVYLGFILYVLSGVRALFVWFMFVFGCVFPLFCVVCICQVPLSLFFFSFFGSVCVIFIWHLCLGFWSYGYFCLYLFCFVVCICVFIYYFVYLFLFWVCWLCFFVWFLFFCMCCLFCVFLGVDFLFIVWLLFS